MRSAPRLVVASASRPRVAERRSLAAESRSDAAFCHSLAAVSDDRHDDRGCRRRAPEAAAPAPDGAAPATAPTDLLIEVDGKLVPNYDATIKPFDEGDVVTGEVVRIDKDEVLVDIGYKSEGVIPSHELSIRRSVDPADEVALGEQVDALVLTKEDQEGRLILSKKRARFEKAWRKIEAAAESGEPVEGTVIEVVKGGLILDLGVRGFLPASLVDIRRVHNLDEFMGQTLECKVIELNRSRNNVVLSRRAVLEEERKEVREQILGRLQPGQVVEGKISNIVDFGAFVDLEGIDGLIHISELSWSHVNHPSEVLDDRRDRAGQGARHRPRPPADLARPQADAGGPVADGPQRATGPATSLEGKVTKVVAFGAFVEIVPGVEGLVHISELAEHHVENPSEVVQPGRGGPGEDPRDRRGAPPDLALDQARRRGPEPAAARPDAGRAAGEQEPTAPPEGVPDLDLSEEVFAEPARPPAAEQREEPGSEAEPAPASAAEPAPSQEPDAEPAPAETEARAPRSAAERRSPRADERAEAPDARARGRVRARADDCLGGGTAALHRADRRRSPPASPRRCRVRAPRRRDDLDRRGRPRAARHRTRCATCWSSAGATEVAPDGEVDRGAVGEIVFERPDELAWLESQLHPRVGERVVAWRESLPAEHDARRGRGAAAVRDRHRGRLFDATVCVIAADDERAPSGRARAGPPTSRRASGRQLTQDEKAARADLRGRQRRHASRSWRPSSPSCSRARGRAPAAVRKWPRGRSRRAARAAGPAGSRACGRRRGVVALDRSGSRGSTSATRSAR